MTILIGGITATPQSIDELRQDLRIGRYPNGSASEPSIRAEADQDTGVFFPTANAVAIGTGGVERLRMDATGSVGIGTNAPLQRLDVTRQTGLCVVTIGGGSGTNEGAAVYIRQASSTDTLTAFGDRAAILGGTPSQAAALWSGARPLELHAGVVSLLTSSIERLRIDANGNVGIGTTSPSAILDIQSNDPTIKISDLDGAARRAAIQLQTLGGNWTIEQDNNLTIKNATPGSAITTGAYVSLGRNTEPLMLGTNGTERMRITSDGSVGIGVISPTARLSIRGASGNTYLDIASPDTRRYSIGAETNAFGIFDQNAVAYLFRFDLSRHMLAGTDNNQNLGTAANRWGTVFAGTGTINTSDEREKVWRGPMNAAEMRAAKRIIGELGMFQFTASVEEKGEDARLHFGVRAQAAFAILKDEGLDWWRYAWCCHDKWEELTEPVMEEVTVEKTRTVTREQTDPEAGETIQIEIEETYEEVEQRDTGETRIVREAGDRYGIRSDQLAFWLIAAQAEIQSDLDARLTKLEGRGA